MPPDDYALIRLRQQMQRERERAKREARREREYEDFLRRAREPREQADAKPAIGHPREYDDDKIKDIAKGILREQGSQSASVLAGKVEWACKNVPQYKHVPCPKERKLRDLCGEALKELRLTPSRPPQRRP